jgi:hypothetical protein
MKRRVWIAKALPVATKVTRSGIRFFMTLISMK